jgi:hypothetical protein
MFCTQCGNQIDDGKNFCGNCGASAARTTEPATDAEPRPFAAARTDTNFANKPLLLVGGILVALIAGAAGLYFGTDLLRSSDDASYDDRPGRSAATVGAPPPMDDRPGRPAATAGAPPPRSDRPGRSAATVGASPPSAARPSSPSTASRRTDAAGTYETLRDTSVFEGPSASAKVVASIPRGTRVNVVRSTGSWLEVRSKSGKPPGFIRRGDAIFVERPG